MKKSTSNNIQKKKLVFIHSYFYPDNSAGSQMLSDLSFSLSSNAFNVSIIASRKLRYGNANKLLKKEEINGTHVYRVWSSNLGRKSYISRAIDYITLEISLLIKIFSTVQPGDIVILMTEPPMFNVLAYPIVRFKKGVIVNWVFDLFPEVAVSAGLFSKKSFINKFFQKLRDYAFKRVNQNIVIGNAMFDYLINLGVNENKITLIQNWSDGKAIQPISSINNPLCKEWNLTGKFVVGYSGNLGLAHDISTILTVIWKLRLNLNIVFLFIGSGAGLYKIKKYVEDQNLKNVIFKPFQDSESLSLSLSVADIHWLTLNPKMEGYIMPSKFYGILAAGRPVIFIGDIEGEIAREIDKIGCGCSLEIGESKKLEDIIIQYADNPEFASKVGNKGRQKFLELYDFPVASMKFLNLFNEL
jgi:colanic acid biosynthesis glycosyl transferase WcaI